MISSRVMMSLERNILVSRRVFHPSQFVLKQIWWKEMGFGGEERPNLRAKMTVEETGVSEIHHSSELKSKQVAGTERTQLLNLSLVRIRFICCDPRDERMLKNSSLKLDS